jgi:nucleoside-diphosphate-sugar epimerase
MQLSASTRVLVTGASGLIGSHVAAQLGGQADVVCVSRAERSSEGVSWIAADLSHHGTASRIVGEVEPAAVIHLAGAVRGDRTVDAVLPTLYGNLVATVELLEAVTRAGVQRIVVSGSFLEEPAEPAATKAPSPYGASRWSSSLYARTFHALFGTPVTVLRPSYTYGPGQDDEKLIPHVISSVLRGESPALASGERYMDFVYAEDMARAFIHAVTAPAVDGLTIDVGSGQLTQVREVVESVLDLLGPDVPRPEYDAIAVRPFEQELTVDTEPARRLLGWSATTPLREGLRKTVEWYTGRERAPSEPRRSLPA